MKRRWVVIGLVVGLLAMAVTTGAVLSYTGDGDSPYGTFASRVAAILGVDQAQVQDALDQAAREIQDEAIQNKLNRLVESGRLTQEQADEYLEWYLARPESGLHGRFLPGLRGWGFFGGPRFHGHGHPAPAPETTETTSL